MPHIWCQLLQTIVLQVNNSALLVVHRVPLLQSQVEEILGSSLSFLGLLAAAVDNTVAVVLVQQYNSRTYPEDRDKTGYVWVGVWSGCVSWNP